MVYYPLDNPYRLGSIKRDGQDLSPDFNISYSLFHTGRKAHLTLQGSSDSL